MKQEIIIDAQDFSDLQDVLEVFASEGWHLLRKKRLYLNDDLPLRHAPLLMLKVGDLRKLWRIYEKIWLDNATTQPEPPLTNP